MKTIFQKISRINWLNFFPFVLEKRQYTYHKIKKEKDITCPQISIFQIESSVFFGSVAEIKEKISSHIKNGGKICIIRMTHINLINATGVRALESLLKETKASNITIIFSNAKPQVIEVFEKTRLIEEVGRENFFDHTSDAISFAVAKLRKMGRCRRCLMQIFNECKK